MVTVEKSMPGQSLTTRPLISYERPKTVFVYFQRRLLLDIFYRRSPP